MGTIFLHQLQDHLKSLRLQISLVVVLVLFAANGMTYVWKYERLAKNTPHVNADVKRRYDQVEKVNDLVGRFYRIMSDRLPTEFMTEGGANWFGDAFYLNPETGSSMFYSGRSRSSNHWMRRYEVADWTLIVRLVLSFLCIVLAYDAVSGEMESGTLRLLMANSLARGQVLLGKYLAYLVVLLLVTLLGSLVSLLILSLNGTVQLNGEVMRGYFMFLLGTALYVSLFLFLAMGISTVARNSATSLVLLILAWAVLIVVIPQTSYLVGTQSVEVDSDWKGMSFQHLGEVRQNLSEEGLVLRQRELAQRDDFAQEKRYALRLNAAEKEARRILQDGYDKALRQYRIARTVNMLSPGFAFQYAVEAFLATGLQRYQHFERQAWRYYDGLRDFIRTRDAADADSPHVLFVRGYMSDREMDSNNIPRFGLERLPLANSVRAGVVPIAVLVLEVLLAFFFALWAFNRADISG